MAAAQHRTPGSSSSPLSILPSDEFAECRREATRRLVALEQVVVERGLLSEQELLQRCAAAVGASYFERLKDRPVPERFLDRVGAAFARKHFLLGVGQEDGVLEVASARPFDPQPLHDVAQMTGLPVRPAYATRETILGRINEAYSQRRDLVGELVDQMPPEEVLREAAELAGENLLEMADKAPVIKLVNMVLFEALKRRASDVHLQPYEDRVQVRFRIDGILYDTFQAPQALAAALVSRIKVMGNMDIAEHLLPQDGRTTVRIGQKVVDLRISSLPGSLGERVVLRLLDKSARLYQLSELGMGPALLERFEKLITSSHGIILVTGPTGSGKSTTLYAALQRINSVENNVLTIEDPIEYQLSGISQTQVSTRKGVTFATGLRTILRQDPDVIMVGEIRDPETARMATQAALTGHLVFSTLHTNDSAGAISRMLDLGIEPFLVSSSVLAVLAQRLVRRICPHCKEQFAPERALLEQLGVEERDLPQMQLWKGRGCNECMHSGYRDRLGIYELLVVDETIRQLIGERAPASRIKRAALENGMLSLRMDGTRRTLEGVTTPEEVLRVTQVDDF